MASSVFIANVSSSDFNKMLIGFSLCFSVKKAYLTFFLWPF